MIIAHSVRVALVLGLLLMAGCAPTAAPPSEPETQPSVSPSSVPEDETEEFLASLADLGGTEWTGLDDTFNDRITFVFGVDGSLSYRTAEGDFSDPADTWSVDGEVLVFQATYGGSFGVGSHTASYDPATGVMIVDYTTSTNRSSSYTLSQVD
ncbi:hypothetical protein [Microcella sp.]|uniref:hypothetical protein n=1 Tax=Microcella sp. TaxID=1913979 RepID=UPI003F71DFB0